MMYIYIYICVYDTSVASWPKPLFESLPPRLAFPRPPLPGLAWSFLGWVECGGTAAVLLFRRFAGLNIYIYIYGVQYVNVYLYSRKSARDLYFVSFRPGLGELEAT